LSAGGSARIWTWPPSSASRIQATIRRAVEVGLGPVEPVARTVFSDEGRARTVTFDRVDLDGEEAVREKRSVAGLGPQRTVIHVVGPSGPTLPRRKSVIRILIEDV
jgi:hypothetical protein